MRVSEQKLRDIALEILVMLGEDRANAELAAAALVAADMRGVNTHGINLLRLVSQRVAAGMLALPTRIETLKDDPTTAVLDGNNGLGQVAACRASGLGVGKAKQAGLGMVVVRNTNNLGALGYYTAQSASQDGVVAILMTNGNASVAPFGSADPFFGTNPFSIAVPSAEGRALVLDMSASVVARGKIRLAAMSGESIPLGWACDETGEPTTDPKRALKGSLLPLGGPKGSGLAMMIDILSGVLSGSSYGRGLKSFHELDGATGVGACFIAIDIGRFVDPGSFARTIGEYVGDIKSLRKQPGVNEILVPGEVERIREEESRRLGIELPAPVVKSTDEILASLGSRLRIGT
ncbi:MAG: Ldh family oxidoreductase [Spirochaetes bacterium]|nr:Ldh family oxidoreductase [Spirochaetota bacterium]